MKVPRRATSHRSGPANLLKGYVRKSTVYSIHDERKETKGLRKGDQHRVLSLEALRLIKISLFF